MDTTENADRLMAAYLSAAIGPNGPTYAVVPRAHLDPETLVGLPVTALYALTPDGIRPIFDGEE